MNTDATLIYAADAADATLKSDVPRSPSGRGRTQASQVLDLTVGELVEVRSVEEILATLDDSGELDAMPFMPEMLQFVGQRFRVYKRAHKTCDTATRTGGRSVAHAVHLSTRCDGSAHGGCQAACLLFWKEAWLRRVPASDSVSSENATPPAFPPETFYRLERAARRTDPAQPGIIYSCQATQVPKFSAPLTWWNPRQYVRDVTSGNTEFRKAAFVLGRATINAIQRWRGGREFPAFPIPTNKSKTPKQTLDLKPGELVQVKSAEEIAETLDGNSRNRGLYFDAEMVRWCGGTFRVQSRVSRIIDERTGRMLNLPNECIILEGVACRAECSRGRLLCPREIPHYWREIWLRRVSQPERAGAASSENGCDEQSRSDGGVLRECVANPGFAKPHFFTVDVEEYFQVKALESVIAPDDWLKQSSRVGKSVDVLLAALARHNARGTFFVLGWLAKHRPEVVRAIADAGHEVASHGFAHQPVTALSPARFREDIRSSKRILEDLTGQRVLGYRAPNFSIVPGYEWAFDVLIEEDYCYDSSLFPIRRRGYGYPASPRKPYVMHRRAGALAEFPLATTSFLRLALPAAGGAYLRQFPLAMIRRAFRESAARGESATFYIHPWELDPDQPRLRVSAFNHVRHYRGLATAQSKIEALLAEFRFDCIASFLPATAAPGTPFETTGAA